MEKQTLMPIFIANVNAIKNHILSFSNTDQAEIVSNIKYFGLQHKYTVLQNLVFAICRNADYHILSSNSKPSVKFVQDIYKAFQKDLEQFDRHLLTVKWPQSVKINHQTKKVILITMYDFFICDVDIRTIWEPDILQLHFFNKIGYKWSICEEVNNGILFLQVENPKQY